MEIARQTKHATTVTYPYAVLVDSRSRVYAFVTNVTKKNEKDVFTSIQSINTTSIMKTHTYDKYMSAEKLYYQNKKVRKTLLGKTTIKDLELHEAIITSEFENIDLLDRAYVKRHIIEYIINRKK